MRKFLVALFLATLACSMQACTSKSSMALTPPVIHPLDSNGGGPAQNCGDSCPAPDPTP